MNTAFNEFSCFGFHVLGNLLVYLILHHDIHCLAQVITLTLTDIKYLGPFSLSSMGADDLTLGSLACKGINKIYT